MPSTATSRGMSTRAACARLRSANQLTNKPKPSFDATGQMKKKMKTTPQGDHAAAADAAKQQLAIEQAAHPFQSARTHALKVGSNELMDYSAPRQRRPLARLPSLLLAAAATARIREGGRRVDGRRCDARGG